MKDQQVSFRYIPEATKKALKKSPCMCVYVIKESVNKGKRSRDLLIS